MKFICIFITLFLFCNNSFTREIGETEIITEEGIEVYQKEKFYLLKKNVQIKSDDFNLNGNNIRIDFDENLYDIVKIDAKGKVYLNSNIYNIKSKGENLKFIVKEEDITVSGLKSELINQDLKMFSDGIIKVNNKLGEFNLSGDNSKLINQNTIIIANQINGTFIEFEGSNKVEFLDIYDPKTAYVKTDDTEMFANIIKFDNEKSIILLENNVKISRNDETIYGDSGIFDIKNNSYKIKSNDSKNVKVIISNTNE